MLKPWLTWLTGLICGMVLMCAGTAGATNTPCSQRKGGINHCEAGRFICNDGSVSQSKKRCGLGDSADKPSKPTKKTH